MDDPTDCDNKGKKIEKHNIITEQEKDPELTGPYNIAQHSLRMFFNHVVEEVLKNSTTGAPKNITKLTGP